MHKVNSQIFEAIELNNTPQEERYFVIDDTILAKLGKKIENVSYIFDHNLGRSVLGFCMVTLRLFADESAVTTYAHRLWDFFRGLFLVSFSTIFDLFKINEDFQDYLDALTDALKGLTPFQGCET